MKISVKDILSEDVVQELRTKVTKKEPEDSDEWLYSFAYYLVERFIDTVDPIIQNGLIQCTCTHWLGMADLQRGWCPNCPRPIKVLIGESL